MVDPNRRGRRDFQSAWGDSVNLVEILSPHSGWIVTVALLKLCGVSSGVGDQSSANAFFCPCRLFHRCNLAAEKDRKVVSKIKGTGFLAYNMDAFGDLTGSVMGMAVIIPRSSLEMLFFSACLSVLVFLVFLYGGP